MGLVQIHQTQFHAAQTIRTEIRPLLGKPRIEILRYLRRIGCIVQTDIKQEIPTIPGVIIRMAHPVIHMIVNGGVPGKIPIDPGHDKPQVFSFLRHQDFPHRIDPAEKPQSHALRNQHTLRFFQGIRASLQEIKRKHISKIGRNPTKSLHVQRPGLFTLHIKQHFLLHGGILKAARQDMGRGLGNLPGIRPSHHGLPRGLALMLDFRDKDIPPAFHRLIVRTFVTNLSHQQQECTESHRQAHAVQHRSHGIAPKDILQIDNHVL